MRLRRSTILTWVLAFGGMGVGHWLTYVLAHPDAHDRSELLASTGHALWGPLALAAAMAAFVAAGSAAVAGVLRSGRSPRDYVVKHAASLIVLQCSSFVAVEALERALAADHSSSLWGGGLLLIGLIVQVATACVALAVGVVVTAVVARATPQRIRLPIPALRQQFVLVPADAPVYESAHLSVVRLRGPPRMDSNF